MSAWGLVVAKVLLYAAFPFCFAFFRRPVRLVLCYVYVAMVLLVGGFFGSVFAVPLSDPVTLSAGSVLYGALILTAFMLVAGGHDPRVIRNLVKIVVAVNVFKIALFSLTAEALRTPGVVNRFGVLPEVFTVSLTVVLVGGLLIVAELALIAVVLEAVKWRVRARAAQAALQVLLFVAVLVLDGVVFPVLLFVAVLVLDGVVFPVLAAPTSPDLGALVAGGVQAKLVLALAYAVPLLLFVLVHGRRRGDEVGEPFRFTELFFTPRDDLLVEVQRQHRALEAGTERYRQLVESTADAVVALTPDGRITSWNPAAARLHGVTEAGALGRHWSTLLPRLDRAEVDARLATVLGGRKVSDVETDLDAPDGGRTYVSLTISPVRDDGRVVGVSVFGRDTTERHRMQEALAHQALHDSLTGLPNRTLLVDRLEQALAAGRARGRRRPSCSSTSTSSRWSTTARGTTWVTSCSSSSPSGSARRCGRATRSRAWAATSSCCCARAWTPTRPSPWATASSTTSAPGTPPSPTCGACPWTG
nr:GGDEF domain-containing protein [Actinotalea solisilvae]